MPQIENGPPAIGARMPFPESLKRKIRERALYHCCLCQKKSVSLEIHHIIPEAEGGPDTEDNAAPLCPCCHGDFGGNPEKRLRIREMRDRWYDVCENCVIGSTRHPMQGSLEPARYSFACNEFVHPLIVRELLGWISDTSETVVGVDLDSANSSNRFHGDFEIDNRDGRKWVKWKEPESARREFFEYAHIAASPTGVEMVECYDCGGGSGVFGRVGLFLIDPDRALDESCSGRISTRDRQVLKILGSIGLGDKYKGKITYDDKILTVGRDEGRFKSRGSISESRREFFVL